MVHLVSVETGFEAKLIAARLGADGVISELRGGVDGPYPVGRVHLYVLATDLDLAIALLVPVPLDESEMFEIADPSDSESSEDLTDVDVSDLD